MAQPKKTKPKSDSKDAKPKAKTPTPKRAPKQRERVKVSMGAFLLHVSFALTALTSVSVAMYFKQPVAWAMETTGGLWGEILLDSNEQAQKFADLSIQEATDIWKEPASNWHTMFNNTRLAKNGLTVECRRISEGSYKESEIHLARSEGMIRGVSAQEVYEFMTSPQGFALLDRVSNSTDFYQPIEQIPDWREGQAKTEIAELSVPGYGPFSDRHFLVLSSTIPEERILVAKSVLHSSRPGASAMYSGNEAKETTDGRVRSVTTFAFQVDTKVLKGGEEVVVVKMISYINLFFIHESIMSFASCRWMFPDLYRDLQLAFNAKRHLQQK